MSPAPDELRAVADRLRRTSAVLVSTLDPLRRRGGPDTWAGPLATSYRAGLVEAGRGVEELAAALQEVAARLDVRADQLQAQARVARREADLRRAEEDRLRRAVTGVRDRMASRSGAPPSWTPGLDRGDR